MAISLADQKLLSTFPKPPPGPPSPAKSPLPSPGPIRASDMGFIPVGGGREDDADSLYSDPPRQTHVHVASETTAAPLPSVDNAELQLVLDTPSRVYSPLDTITGYVLGWNPSSADIQVILEGRAKTYIRADKTLYKDRVALLYETIQLKANDHGAALRFSLTIPERCASGLERLNDFAPRDLLYGRYWSTEWPAQEPYECHAGHPLPPSMSMPVTNSTTALISIISGGSYVSYRLIAVRSELDSSTGKLKSNAACQVPIRLTTRRLPPAKVLALTSDTRTAASDLSIQTAQLSKLRRLSLREQLRDTFSTSAPNFCFKANVSTPKLSTPGADLKIAISVSVLPPPPGKLYNFPVPNISIVSLSFRVRSYTGLRVLRPFLNEDLGPKAHTFKGDELRTSQSPSGATFKPKDGGFDGQSCVSTITLPKTILPSFKTYNMWRSYRLKCDVVFAIASKEVSTHIKSDLNIIARPTGDVETTEGGRQETDREDDAVGMKMAQAIVETGLQLVSTI